MQQEGYDSWEGFVSAGFAAEDDGGIHLAGAKGWCSVWRRVSYPPRRSRACAASGYSGDTSRQFE